MVANLYNWGRAQTGFAKMIHFAWYVEVETTPVWMRRNASKALRMITLASEVIGFDQMPVNDVSQLDLIKIKTVFSDQGVDQGAARIAIQYLLKFLAILKENKLTDLNVIDVAMAL